MKNEAINLVAVGKRIALFMKREGYNAVDCAKIISAVSDSNGLTAGTIRGAINGKHPATDKTITKILRGFPKIRNSWLKYNRGVMFDGDVEKYKAPKPVPEPEKVEEPSPSGPAQGDLFVDNAKLAIDPNEMVVSMERSAVYKVIDAERDYQVLKWGDADVNRLTPTEFLVLIQNYVNKAVQVAAKERPAIPVIHNIRKIAALGVACMEVNGIAIRRVED